MIKSNLSFLKGKSKLPSTDDVDASELNPPLNNNEELDPRLHPATIDDDDKDEDKKKETSPQALTDKFDFVSDEFLDKGPKQDTTSKKPKQPLKTSNPHIAYYLGAVQIFGSKRGIPASLQKALKHWLTIGIDHDDQSSEQQQECSRPCQHANFEAQSNTKITIKISFILPQNKKIRHVPGYHKGTTYGGAPSMPTSSGKKRKLDMASRPAPKLVRKTVPSASTEDIFDAELDDLFEFSEPHGDNNNSSGHKSKISLL
ncbi:hypothetical protein ACHAQI_011105 [Fusarium lateritium]